MCNQMHSNHVIRHSLLLLIAGLMLGDLTVTHAQTGEKIAGCWIRENDSYRGWVVEIGEVDPGEYEAKSLWVPASARELYSFQIGEKKLQRIRLRNDGIYRLESMRRDEDGNANYEKHELSFSSADRFVMVADSPNGELGDKQVWRRLSPDEIGMAYADYGRGSIAENRERYSAAATAYQRAAKRLLQEQELKSHRDLANGLAWQLGTSRSAELRNPQLALQLVPALGDWFSHTDTAAAVHAANGNFDAAIQLQEKAVREISGESAAEIYLRNNGLNSQNFLLLFGAGMMVAQEKPDYVARLELYRQKQPYRR